MYVPLLLFFFIGDSIARDVESCYAKEDERYLYMGTKTAYAFIKGTGSEISQIPQCEPMQLWMAAKHDARYPLKEKIARLSQLPQLRDQIITNHEQEQSGHMCNQDLDNLKSWWFDPNMKVEMAGDVAQRSIDDIKLFARRLQSNFPELLRVQYGAITPDNYVFRTSGSKAAQTTAESFKEGLFHSEYVLRDPSQILGEDTLIKTYENCSRTSLLEEFTMQNAFEERNKFLNSTHFTNVQQNVSRRTGFKYELSKDTILIMYDMCRFDKAWMLSKLSPWCSVFSEVDLKVLEYAEDIMYYYGSGYGRQDKTQLGCYALKDIVEYFKQLEKRMNNDGMPKGLFYFTDTISILGILTALDVRKDDQMLLASNYNDMAKRQWRTSFMGPFNSNLIVIFYRCEDKESPNKVMFYFQEEPLMLEGCQVGLCDWEYLKNKFSRVIDKCNSVGCRSENASVSIHQTISLLLIAVLLIPTWQI